MARRKVDVSMIQGLVQGAVGQEVTRGAKLSIDPNFPVFSTPVNEDILVYFPRVNCTTDENGETMNVLTSLVHDYKKGNSFGKIRCIHGLTGNDLFNTLGYDGTCPACEAVNECWDLFNKKLANEAKRMGVDPQNDPSNVLKSIKETLRGEMDMKGADEYVTFPIVIIPQKAKMTPSDDAANNLKCVYVTWRKKRYVDSILSALDSLRNNPGHPAGLFWYWKFSYDTNGKQANARDAAKNAKYNIITDAEDLKYLIPACEEKAKNFTIVKAAEVIVANQFMYKEDMVEEVDKIMAKTRTFNELANTIEGSVALPAGANPLANFGGQIADTSSATKTEEAPQVNLGVQSGFGGMGSPVKFG